MGRIGHGYGSEWHLLRWMGRHRARFDALVLKTIGAPGATVEWLDFPIASTGKESEWKGLDFLCDEAVRDAWARFWPRSGGAHNWDAVGWTVTGSTRELLLVEAKAHPGEIRSDCGATSKTSRERIAAALAQAQLALNVSPAHDWLRGYYQYANRLATLCFLQAHKVPARLLFIYFTGDRVPRRAATPSVERPQTPQDWRAALLAQLEHLGLTARHPLAHRVHMLFLPVHGPAPER